MSGGKEIRDQDTSRFSMWKGLPWFHKQYFLAALSCDRRTSLPSSSYFIRALITFLVTCSKPYLFILLGWGLSFNTWNLEGHTYWDDQTLLNRRNVWVWGCCILAVGIPLWWYFPSSIAGYFYNLGLPLRRVADGGYIDSSFDIMPQVVEFLQVSCLGDPEEQIWSQYVSGKLDYTGHKSLFVFLKFLSFMRRPVLPS